MTTAADYLPHTHFVNLGNLRSVSVEPRVHGCSNDSSGSMKELRVMRLLVFVIVLVAGSVSAHADVCFDLRGLGAADGLPFFTTGPISGVASDGTLVSGFTLEIETSPVGFAPVLFAGANGLGIDTNPILGPNQDADEVDALEGLTFTLVNGGVVSGGTISNFQIEEIVVYDFGAGAALTAAGVTANGSAGNTDNDSNLLPGLGVATLANGALVSASNITQGAGAAFAEVKFSFDFNATAGVPEPSAISLCVLGLCGVGFRRRRRAV